MRGDLPVPRPRTVPRPRSAPTASPRPRVPKTPTTGSGQTASLGRPGQGRRPPARRTVSGPLSVFLVFLGLFATSAGLGLASGPLNWPGWGDWFGGSGAGDPPPRSFPVLAPSPPTAIRIPSIGVRAPVHRVGLAADGSIAVPPLRRHDEAGWYGDGPTPGQFGPAIVVGHVDTRTGPSVFYRLDRLERGATIEVTRRDRRVAIFRVDSVERFDKGSLPAQRVYGDFRRPGLRLITCGGRWRGGGIGYADNVVVFATLTAARPA